MQMCYLGVEIINNKTYQKWINMKKAPMGEVEESIVVEEENNSIMQRRGLIIGKKIPLKKY